MFSDLYLVSLLKNLVILLILVPYLEAEKSCQKVGRADSGCNSNISSLFLGIPHCCTTVIYTSIYHGLPEKKKNEQHLHRRSFQVCLQRCLLCGFTKTLHFAFNNDKIFLFIVLYEYLVQGSSLNPLFLLIPEGIWEYLDNHCMCSKTTAVCAL
jgi:hypothetical protein